ncbi:hypothetical protein ABW19_dt0204599 [Dactylella cylindrospora]|nr:hypothetical protein ABW19_dt0204599 [Dactylella cylindrospora]
MAPLPEIPSSTNLAGYSALITGSNTGIGFENARQYLQLGVSPVYLAVRNVDKGEQAKRELLSDQVVKRNNPDAVVQIYPVDLASFESIKTFATKFTEEVKQLNILVLNAGVSYMKFVPTKDGGESTFQVNYLSNTLLASYLLPILKASAASSGKPSHLAFVSSSMQNVGGFGTRKVIPEDKNIIEYFNDKSNMALDRYNVSKLLITAYTNELASHVNSDEVIINSMCPGLVATNFDANSPFWLKSIMKIVRTFAARSASDGARALTLATLTGPEGSGKFYSNGKVTPPAAYLATEDGKKFQKKLWAQTQEQLLKIDPTVPAI